MLAKMAMDSLRLDTRKPTQITHQVSQSRDATTGDLQLNSENYNTKLRGNRVCSVYNISLFLSLKSCGR